MVYEKSCGAVIYTEQNGKRFYLVELMQKGHCSICKGHVEGNESEHQTAAREIFEETGLSVDFVNGFQETIAYSPYEDCVKTVVFFLAFADSTDVTVQEEEVKEIRWLPIEEALTALTFDSDRETVQKAEDFLKKLTFNSK
ncbi:MAG: NUDIX domain-containing protein [Oscillospiraceae bacterium]|nr:NUDIX domain-containing protein [Oscillospiraceae bacterium]